MRIRYADRSLARLESDAAYDAGFGRPVVKGFRKVIAWIRAASDERDLYAFKSLHYEKLKGGRSGQRSIRLNDQFRLILELQPGADGQTVVVISIEDYH